MEELNKRYWNRALPILEGSLNKDLLKVMGFYRRGKYDKGESALYDLMGKASNKYVAYQIAYSVFHSGNPYMLDGVQVNRFGLNAESLFRFHGAIIGFLSDYDRHSMYNIRTLLGKSHIVQTYKLFFEWWPSKEYMPALLEQWLTAYKWCNIDVYISELKLMDTHIPKIVLVTDGIELCPSIVRINGVLYQNELWLIDDSCCIYRVNGDMEAPLRLDRNVIENMR